MIVSPELEDPRPAAGADSSDGVTFSFGDAARDVFGVARIGLSGEPATASGLAVLFSGSDVVAVRALGGEAVAERAWNAIGAAGVSSTVERPLEAWTVTVAEQDGTGARLRFEALSDPSWVDAESDVGKAGGMEGYEQVCRVTGTVTIAGRAMPIDCLGQRGHSWGAPDWDAIARARTVNAWIDDELALSLVAIAPAARKRANHDAEAIGAALFTSAPRTDEDDADEDPHPPRSSPSTCPSPGCRPRSTTAATSGVPGFELIFDPDGHPRRGAGEVRCGTSIDLGALRLDCAFFTWRMEGREGVGRYDIVSRA